MIPIPDTRARMLECPMRNVLAAEDVRADGDQPPEPDDPAEEDQHRPEQIEKRIVVREH
jgi:hypothetical protein